MSKNVDEAISRKEEKHVMSYIPNMITIANFVCGLLAIYAVFVHDIYLGAVFIITGMLFDFLMVWSLGNLMLFRNWRRVGLVCGFSYLWCGTVYSCI